MEIVLMLYLVGIIPAGYIYKYTTRKHYSSILKSLRENNSYSEEMSNNGLKIFFVIFSLFWPFFLILWSWLSIKKKIIKREGK